MELSNITALSPLDGRYQKQTQALRPFLSEYGLIYYRVLVEIKWLEALARHPDIQEVAPLDSSEEAFLAQILTDFSAAEAEKVKKHEAVTNHDVKAVEYYLKDKLANHPTLALKSEFIHFACTSEDINNLSYSLMVKDALAQVINPAMDSIIAKLREQAHSSAEISMLSRTHGQTASPTTLGKELANVVARLQQQAQGLTSLRLTGKINGAVGNFNAHSIVYPEVDWPKMAENFVENSLGLQWMPYTTQIEPHDRLAEVFQATTRLNTILIDLSRDLWGYISLGYFSLKVIATETGSSTMPHKVNPIDFENAEGNFGMANAMLNHLAEKLPISRWQRDLSDSTVLRNIGSAFGQTLLALTSLEKGLGKISPNQPEIAADLDNSWEVLGEAIQTVMRRYGLPKPYEQLKEYTRGKAMNQESLHGFIDSTNLPAEEKTRLKDLTPASYIGNAVQFAQKI
jgi:adenylosuccinate lyase